MSSALVIPVAIASVAFFQLSDKLDGAASSFFDLSVVEQVSLLALIFSVIFAAVSLSHMGYSKQSKTIQKDYPIAEMSQKLSDKDKFKCLFPMLREEMLQHLKNNDLPQEAIDWCEEMMDYNVPGGKLNRGTTVVAVYRALKRRALSEQEIARASVLGWAIEFLQAFFLVADDVMDDSQTRRGRPCWYKVPKVNLIAINDCFLLESFVFGILGEHFGHEHYYHDLVELMLDVVQKTEFGQLLDLTSQPADGKIDLDRFTLERYRKIVKFKTAFYSFYLPVAMGMIMSGIQQKSAYTLAKKICCIMGEYFQIQDDYLDCFGDPSVIGKVGTDIQDNKCSWLVVQALKRCSPTQRSLLESNYGQWNDKKVAKVKDLYKELDLPKVFAEYEEESYQAIQAELDKVTLMPRDVFELLLKKIYKRSK